MITIRMRLSCRGRGACVALLLTLAASLAVAESRCRETGRGTSAAELICTYRTTRIASSDITARDVIWELPLGEPPAGGWPVVLIYQGAFSPIEFSRRATALFGGYHEMQTIRLLLDSGYAVLAPRAAAGSAWFTNTLGPLTPYELTTDFTFLNNVFAAIGQGVFGPLNGARKYAVGISSGGYNTSRMALSWPGQFKALVVHSASWATCAAALCTLPREMPPDHPPTKFIHGLFDTLAPWYAMDRYYDRLLYEGIETSRLTVYYGGHEWFEQSPQAVVDWFGRHP